MTLFITAFALGLLGSLHCVGMCGPIALALPLNNGTKANRITAALLYNIGRATTYLLIGTIIGFFGQGFSLIGVQQIVSISLGSLILLSYIIPDVFSKTKFIVRYNKWFYSVKQSMQFLFSKKSLPSMFAIGSLNGLLPCGLVYIAITASITLGTIKESALFMMYFGLGTFPMMLSIVLLKNLISHKFRLKINSALPTLMMIMAVFLIVRGLNLGIPFISPKMDNKSKLVCHSPSHNKKLAHQCVSTHNSAPKK